MNYGVSIKWHTIACFEIKFGDFTVLSDPCITVSEGTDATWESVEACDLITISHVHWDHVTDLPVLTRKFNPHVLVGELSALPLLNWMDYNPSSVYAMTPDLELDFGPAKVRALFGKHVDQWKMASELWERMNANPVLQADPELNAMQILGSLEYRNYLFTAKNGTKVLLWGNNPRPEQQKMLEKLQPDIAVVQFTKHEPDEMAAFVQSIGAKVVIPHHMDLHSTEEEYLPKVLRFKEAYEKAVPEGIFVVPRHGEWVEL